MQNDDDIPPQELGVYICSEHAEADPSKLSKHMRKAYDHYGFSSRKEILEYIKENADIDDYFVLYTFDVQFGQTILKPLKFGTRDDLYGDEEI